MEKIKNESEERLYRAISALKTPEECRAFFEDLCTIREIEDMAQRLDTAILLDRGMNYQHISETVGVSTATISRVNRCHRYGSGGYRTALRELKENDSDFEN